MSSATREFRAAMVVAVTKDPKRDCRLDGAENPEGCTWQRVPPPCFPQVATSRQQALARAAELAARCAQLGLPPPQRQQRKEPAPAPPGLDSRVDALSKQLHQQNSLLATAIQGQTHQLASQKQLLQDVVQSLLFMGAKAARPATAEQQRRPATPACAQARAGAAVITEAVTVGAGNQQGGGTAPLSIPKCKSATLGLTLGPTPTTGAVLATNSSGRPGTEEQEMPLVAPLHDNSPGQAAQNTSSFDAAQPRSMGQGAAVPAAIWQAGRQRARPAWNDRTVIEAGQQQHGGQWQLPNVRNIGGLAPKLLLQELRKLRRQQVAAVGGAATHHSFVLKHPLRAANAALAIQRQGAAMKRTAQDFEGQSDGGTCAQDCHQADLMGSSQKVGQAPSPWQPTAACPAAPRPPPKQQAPEATEADVDAVCERLLRELLLFECTPCDRGRHEQDAAFADV